MTNSYELLRALSTGRFCSGNHLALELGISRNAVWKRIAGLRNSGFEIYAVPGKGYRLNRRVELLDYASIARQIPDRVRNQVAELSVLQSVDSTNTVALGLARKNAKKGTVVIAEKQNSGRGRRGRMWASPFGSNLYFSVIWRFDPAPTYMSTLSLAVGAALASSFNAALGSQFVVLKWPNDLYVGDKKIGGILTEVAGEAGAEHVIVVGVGVNVAMPATAGAEIEQPWTDLDVVSNGRISRNQAAALSIGSVVDALTRFEKMGFAPFRSIWRALDLLVGRQVTVRQGQQAITGVATGIDEFGALCVKRGARTEKFYSGDVSVRPNGHGDTSLEAI